MRFWHKIGGVIHNEGVHIHYDDMIEKEDRIILKYHGHVVTVLDKKHNEIRVVE